MVMCNLGNSFKIRNNIVRIAHTLHIDGSRLLVNSSGKVLELSTSHKLGRHTESGKEHVQLIICAPIQMRTGNNIIAGLCEGGDCQELRGLAR